jgi:tRNA threonylcarbamoyladenosine biosynthesis protein TsaB
MARIELNDIDGYAVTRGPGSFTGLRIGISTAIGFAQASAKPICGVSTLHALAVQTVTSSGIVYPMIDARRGEVYFAGFKKEGDDHLTCYETEQVLKPQDAIVSIKESCTFIGNGATLYQADIKNVLGNKAQIAPKIHNIIRASNVAWLAHQRLLRGDVDDITHFAPTYLRKSDAERNKKKQQNMPN